jgi:hypothetical protein
VTTVAVELLGPPGSGKSTLLAALAEYEHRVAYIDRARTPRGVPYLLRGARAVAPLVLRERTTWQQTRWMVRVEAAALLVCHTAPTRTPAVVFAQGPVYSLARLSGSNLLTPRFADWWSAKTQQLADLLDVVVVLDAPNDVLLHRIRTRQKAHALNRMARDSQQIALARSRSAVKSVLAELTSDGGPEVLCFDTSRTPLVVMTESLLDALRVSER